MLAVLLLQRSNDSSPYYYAGGFRKCVGGLWRYQNPEDRCDKLKAPDAEAVDWSGETVLKEASVKRKNELDKSFKRLLKKSKRLENS